MDVPGRPEPVHPDQLHLRLRGGADRSQHLRGGRPGHGWVTVTVAELRRGVGGRLGDRSLLPRRYELRLHPGVPPQLGDLASHQAHGAHGPVQNRLRRLTHRQLSPVPPPAEPGNVPDQSVISLPAGGLGFGTSGNTEMFVVGLCLLVCCTTLWSKGRS